MFNFKKNKNLQLVIEERQNYRLILSNLIAYLNKSNNNPQAEIIEGLLKLIETENIDSFVKKINSIDMWGGSGAVWEVGIEDESEEKEFQIEIIHLINLMEKTEILERGGKSIRQVFINQLSK